MRSRSLNTVVGKREFSLIHLAFLIAAFLFVFFSHYSYAQEWQSQIVYYGSNGKLNYKSDSDGNKIPDFSYAGYKNGETGIPIIPVVKTIEPVLGDNTSHIQNAINEVASLPIDANGFRGTLLLKAGIYRVYGTINLNESGIILRGEGDGADSLTNTIIYGIGDVPHQRTILVAGGGSLTRWSEQIPGTKTNITSQKVFAGSFKFTVENSSLYQPGDNIIIYHPITEEWIAAVDGGGTASDPAWTTSDAIYIIYNRYIKNIIGDTLVIDAPVFNTLDRSLSQSYVYKYSRKGLKTNIGIENLRVDIETNGIPTDKNGDENHAWQAIELKQIEDAWVTNCTMLHFGQSGIMTSTASRITIDSCNAIDPISIVTGERRYNFNMYHASQLILVKNCYTRYGRHDFVSNGTSTVSGCVFYNNISENTYASSEGHRWWSQGILFDNLEYITPGYSYVVGFYNRGDKGTSHGWAATNSVAWNCKTTGSKNIIIQKPPTGQNYSIGCFAGNVTGLKSKGAPYDQPEGYIEGTNNSGLNPGSLYLAQLNERLNITSVEENQNDNYGIVSGFKLYENYPNPFNPTTTIKFAIPATETTWQVVSTTLKVYDVLGNEIATLVNEEKLPGEYEVGFNGSGLSSGVYFYTLRACGKIATKKFVLMK